MTAAEEKEVHALLIQQMNRLESRMDSGFLLVHEDFVGLRQEISDRMASHRDRFASDIRVVHARIDEHLESHAPPRTPAADSSAKLPAVVNRWRQYCTLVISIGVICGGFFGVLYVLYRAAERGVFGN